MNKNAFRPRLASLPGQEEEAPAGHEDAMAKTCRTCQGGWIDDVLSHDGLLSNESRLHFPLKRFIEDTVILAHEN